MSGSCRSMLIFEDLKLKRKEEKRKRETTSLVYIQGPRHVWHFLSQAQGLVGYKSGDGVESSQV
jgi:hypothetical protein